MRSIKSTSRLLTVCVLSFLLHQSSQAKAATISGSLLTDDQVFQYNFKTTSSQIYTFYTTSYGGGANLDGTSASAGGFVPTLTLFHKNGNVIGPSGTSGAVDPTTGLNDDAYLSEALSAGSYVLALTEFPNAAIGNLSDGFLFAHQGDFTGGLCGGSGSFLETDIAPCAQRTGNYTLNISTAATPEPASWLLVLPATGLFVAFGRRLLA